MKTGNMSMKQQSEQGAKRLPMTPQHSGKIAHMEPGFLKYEKQVQQNGRNIKVRNLSVEI